MPLAFKPALATPATKTLVGMEQEILISAVQFRSEESQQQVTTLLLKKFIVSCFLSSMVEAGVTLGVCGAFTPLTSSEGKVIPVIAIIKLVYILTNWIGCVRVFLSFSRFSYRLAAIVFTALLSLSAIYELADADSTTELLPFGEEEQEEDTRTNRIQPYNDFTEVLWRTPCAWTFGVTLILSQVFMMVLFEYVEHQLSVDIRLIREVPEKALERMLVIVRGMRLFRSRGEAQSFNLMLFISKLFAKVDMDISIQQLLNPENSLVNNTKIDKYRLTFLSPDAEKLFQEEAYPQALSLTKKTFGVFAIVQAFFIVDYRHLIVEMINGDGELTGTKLLLKRACLSLYVIVLFAMFVSYAYLIGVFHEAKSSSSMQLRRFTRVFYLLHVLLSLCVVLMCERQHEFALLFMLIVFANVYFLKTSFHLIFLASLAIVSVHIITRVVFLMLASDYFLALFQPCIVAVVLAHVLQ